MHNADLVAKHYTTVTSSTLPTKSTPSKPKLAIAHPTSSKKSSSAAKPRTKRKKNSSRTDSDYEDNKEFKVYTYSYTKVSHMYSLLFTGLGIKMIDVCC